MPERIKAKVVKIEDGGGSLKARVISVLSSKENVLVVPDDPIEFCRFARDYLKLSSNEGFWVEHMQKLSVDLGVTPVAYQNPGRHWNLITSATRMESGVVKIGLYDPTKGLNEIEGYGLTKVWFFWGGEHTLKNAAADLLADNYAIPVEPLAQLGPIQTDPVNCGPLAVYAARFAKKVSS